MDYAEELFNAVEVLLNKKIETVKFDETIVATVVDASKSDIGVYTVTTGNAKFIAYSAETVYRENDMVLVTIPQGNYNNQKVIIGKSVDSLNTPMIYKSPFQSIIDVSNNLIGENKSFSYWANSIDLIEGRPWNISISDFKNTDLYNQLGNNYFWQCNFSNAPLKGYNRIGIKAAFSTWLSEYNTVAGTYGLALEIIFCLPDQPDQRWSKIVTLDSSGFFGDIYNFESYYMQEEVFNIEDYIDYPIVGLKIFPYQRNNFKDIDGNPVPTKEDDFSSIGPNIFVRDLYVCVGIPIDGFDTDVAEIYCEQGFTYTKTISDTAAVRDRQNTKNIFLRWIHKNENTDLIKTAQYDDSFLSDYKIFWYRYKLGARSPDGFAGAHWERFFGASTDAGADGNFSLSQSDDEATDRLQIRLIPNVNRDFERIKAIVLKQDDEDVYHVIATSNILEFTNEVKSPDVATLLEVNALSIKYDDTEKGHYFLYDEAGDIAKNEDKEVRYVIAVFDKDIHDVYRKADLQVNECESITWSFPPPGGNTMIVPMVDTDQMATWDETNQCWLDAESNRLGQGSNKVGFSIKQHLNNAATSNTIRLEISKEGITYTAQVQPIFGTAGLNGSDYTLVLTWQDGKNAFDISDTDPEYELTGTLDLYDQSGDIVDWPEGVQVKCNWQIADIITNEPAQVTRIKAQEENNVYYPLFKSANKSLFYGTTDIADSNYQSGRFYYFYQTAAVEGEKYYKFSLINNRFEEVEFDSAEQLYKKGKKNKLEFQRVEFTTDPLDQETGNITHTDPPIYKNGTTRCYGYSTNRRYFIKYKDRYILDPWTDYQEAETYYEPIEAKECVYAMVQDGAITQTIGGLTASVDNQDKRIIHITSSGSVDINSLFVLEITLENFGDYPLVNYYPIALKDNSNFTVDYIEGPDRVRYDASGKVNYNKNPYQITARKQENNNLITYRHGYPTSANYSALNGYWRLLLVDGSDQFKPSLDETVIDSSTNQVKVVVNGQYDIPILYPSSVYIPDATPYGVQFVYQPDNNPANDVALWTQPIFVYESRYPSRTLNKWNGKEILTDDDAGTITASGFAAGKKERDNSFTGVMIGDWSRSVADEVVTKNTGIYGFNHGAMAYAFKDDGTGFIGKDGSGRIYFDGGKAQIFSSRWTNHLNPQGMLLDIDDGFIKMQSTSLRYTTVSAAAAKGYFVTLRYGTHSNNKLYNSNHDEIGENDLYSQSIDYYKKQDDEYILLNHNDIDIEATYFTKKTYGQHNEQKLYFYTNATYVEPGDTDIYINGRRYYQSSSDEEKYITIGSNQTTYPLAIGTDKSVSGRNFRVTWDGTAYINNGEFSGTINAESGSIGGWKIEADCLSSTTGATKLYNTGAINAYSITTYNGQIGYWILDGNILRSYAGNAELNGYTGSITTYSGSIGGWTISNGYLTSATYNGAFTQLNANTGEITANKITTSNGSIGGWQISPNGLQSSNGSTKLYPTNGIATNKIFVSTTGSYDSPSGYFGFVQGNDGQQSTSLLGMQATGGQGLVMESSGNIRLSGLGSQNLATGIYLYGTRVEIKTGTGSGNTEGLWINGNRFDGSSYAKFAPDSMNNNSGS